VVDCPFDLLCRDQDFTEESVDFCFTRIETSCSRNIILVLENIPVGTMSVRPSVGD